MSAAIRARLRLLLPAMALLLLFAEPAYADASGFTCNGATPSGSLYDSSAEQCPTTLQTDNVFSFLVCNMENLSGNLMGSMYCGIITNLQPGVAAVLTLAVIFAGLGFITGFLQVSAREFQIFLLKIGLVYAFATQSDYMIGFGYNFLVTGEREGIAVALSGLFPDGGSGATGLQMYGYLDKFLGKGLSFASAMVGADWSNSDTSTLCHNALFDVIVLMSIAFPPLFYVSLVIVGQIVMTFLRAVFGYVYSIVGLTFLVTLAPFFLSFALFKQTKPFFDKYLAYLVSFSLQMVIVFAFLAFVVSIKVDNITSTITGIIVPNKEVQETTSFRFPWKYCTICNFEVVDQGGNEVNPDNYKGFIEGGKLQCKTQDPMTVFSASAASTPGQAQASKALTNELIKFASTALLSLFVLAYIVSSVMRYVPAIAQFLASSMTGGTYVPQLGGGATMGGIRPTLRMPGSGIIDSIDHGFSDGYAANGWKGGTPGAIAAGVKEAAQRMVFGSGSSRIANRMTGGLTEDHGIIDSFATWFINPNPEIPDQ